MNEPTLLLVLPEDLHARIARAAEADATTPQEWVQRAVARQLEERAWAGVLAYGEERARVLGYTEDDVDRLVGESRAEQRLRRRPASDDREPPTS